jgi:hypothetical protein
MSDMPRSEKKDIIQQMLFWLKIIIARQNNIIMFLFPFFFIHLRGFESVFFI